MNKMSSAVLLACFGAVSCARVPPEAVTLSATMGQDLLAVETANRNLVLKLFAEIREDVEDFVETTYRPYIIRKTMEDLNIVEEIRKAADPNSDLDPVDIMEVYAEETLKKIESFRLELLKPIEAQESEVLEDFQEAFSGLKNANSVLTAHLISVRRVTEQQRELLGRIGISQDLQDRMVKSAVGLSETVKGLLDRAKTVEGKLEELPGELTRTLGKAQ